jgi:hypothetical protein
MVRPEIGTNQWLWAVPLSHRRRGIRLSDPLATRNLMASHGSQVPADSTAEHTTLHLYPRLIYCAFQAIDLTGGRLQVLEYKVNVLFVDEKMLR